ncbi:hypothetical protein ABZP36_010570 [Zizania latifolia]
MEIVEKKEYVLEESHLDEPADNASALDQRACKKHANDSVDVSYLMLASISSELQKQYENRDAYDMIVGLKGMFENQARAESMEKSVAKLHGMLKTAEKSIKKSSSHVMMVQKDSKKRKRKGKSKASDKISRSKPKPVRKSKVGLATSDT